MPRARTFNIGFSIQTKNLEEAAQVEKILRREKIAFCAVDLNTDQVWARGARRRTPIEKKDMDSIRAYIKAHPKATPAELRDNLKLGYEYYTIAQAVHRTRLAQKGGK